jgi:5-methylcytosine-specific restriction protein A
MTAAAFSPAVRVLIQQRAGECCERCGRPAPVGSGAQCHHRLPRGMGGSADPVKGRASNGLWLCLDCHDQVERNDPETYAAGWKVRHGQLPADVPVLLVTRYGAGLWLLDDSGNYSVCEDCA